MSAPPPESLSPKLAVKAVLGLAFAAFVAWYVPFDRAFAAATFGIPAARALGIVALAVVGYWAARRIGLGVEPTRKWTIPLVVRRLLSRSVVAAYCLLWNFITPGLAAAQDRRVTLGAPLGIRLFLYMIRAFNENIMYRLFLGSVLIWLIGLIWKGPNGRPAYGAYWLGFAIAQGANAWINVVMVSPITAAAIGYDAARYVVPGLVWSWLYWRWGFQSNEIACTTVHIPFQIAPKLSPRARSPAAPAALTVAVRQKVRATAATASSRPRSFMASVTWSRWCSGCLAGFDGPALVAPSLGR